MTDRSAESPTPENRRDSAGRMPPLVVMAFLCMAVWNALLSGGSAYFYLESQRTDDKFEDIIEVNRRNIEVGVAENCISMHERAVQIQDAIGITPDALVEVAGDNPDTDPAEIQEFLDGIQRRVDEKIKTPTCNLNDARKDLERLEE